ncbi:MAG TPA: 3-hydroxyacyl-CoA dehydrogenase NAD-binding domain-containing protein, partial [Terriglobia bacterium]|nr:3-hydroxyacyl-CoA dehydrogenase NAD-binding domain-containing protein [Terriglobia bacterium]
MNIRLAGVVGAGTMGHGIAQVLVRNGYSVVLHDTTQELVGRGAEKISRGLSRDLEKGRLTVGERQQAESRLKTTVHLSDLASADVVIEAVTEKFEVKADVLRALDALCRPEALFASNTSSISITRLAGVTGRPAQLVGLHFFNPVPVMKLVEVVPGLDTAEETITAAEQIATSVGKTPIRARDFPG